MNTTATSFSSEHSWIAAGTRSRRNSEEESILSIQGKETDFVRDTSDTEWLSDEEQDLEYEPVTEPEDEGPLSGDSSGQSDNEIISTKVIEVKVNDDGDLEFADSEQTDSESDDSELDLVDYWRCAQCRVRNNNPLYRFCEKCYKVRKNFFPPRPKHKPKIAKENKDKKTDLMVQHLADLVDSGVDSAAASQDLSQNSIPPSGETDSQHDVVPNSQINDSQSSTLSDAAVLKPNGIPTNLESGMSTELGSTSDNISLSSNVILNKTYRKRRAESADRNDKRMKIETDSDTDDDLDRGRKSKSVGRDVIPLSKTISDPALTIDVSNQGTDSKADNMCITCYAEPKSGVFVHGRIAHICCCYKCAIKVWSKSKRCPVCNCKVSNVLKAVF